MRQETQVEVLKTLLELRAAGRDQAMLGEVTHIPVSNYTDAEILEQEWTRSSAAIRWWPGMRAMCANAARIC
jgi:hypothetical protein